MLIGFGVKSAGLCNFLVPGAFGSFWKCAFEYDGIFISPH